jgi:CHAD domain-containing protein
MSKTNRGESGHADPALDAFCPAMREAIAKRWEAVWAAAPVALKGDDPEGVHQVRVASRRLRAAMDVGQGCFKRSWYRPLHRAAREITGALGEVRDRDVMMEVLAARRTEVPAAEQAGVDLLIARIERERAVARVAMEAYLHDLFDGDVPRQLSRRFGPKAAPAGHSATRKGQRA